MIKNQELLILGGGPAGISAALTARRRGLNVRIISNSHENTGLYKAAEVDNYPGMPGVSGKELLESMRAHAESAGVSFIERRIINLMPSGGIFQLSDGRDIYSCGAVIIAAGVAQKDDIPGERELLGAGVSYCATCDGMLFRNKRVCVIGLTADAVHEAEFLENIGCEVTFFTDGRMKLDTAGLKTVTARSYEVQGNGVVSQLIADGTEYPADGVFILRGKIAMTSLLPGLELEDGHVKTDRQMRTNIGGVFAAGDCAGPPYQIAKAVGEGCTAALSASEYLRG